MSYYNEAKKLSYNILIDIENNKKDLHLLCLQSSRLALLLNNHEKSKYFSKLVKNSSEIESFISSYGRFIEKLIQKINVNDVYDFNSTIDNYNLRLQRLQKEMEEKFTSLFPVYDTNRLRKPKQDIDKYYDYKQEYENIRSEIYKYAMNIYYQLEFTKNVSDILSEYSRIVDNKLPEILPNSKEKLDSITKNIHSQNREDWSNAVHTCRKLLQDLADKLNPPSDKPIIKNNKEIRLNKIHYVNRFIKFIEDHSKSDKFKQITGSSIKYIGERLDAIYESTNKGTHKTIESLEEAKRYVIYTYLFIGDVLSLKEQS